MKKAIPFILDCSITMTWCFPDEATPSTLAIRDRLLQAECYVPRIWPLEVNNVLWCAVCKKKITDLQAIRFKSLLKELPIQVDLKASDLMNDIIFELAKTYHITCYDAAYLELALREELALATLDVKLKKAAKKAGVVLIDC